MSGTAGSVVGFALLLLTALALQVAARRGSCGVTVARAVGAAMRTTPGRAAVLVVWLWLGVHFLAR
ncbi:DUF6186 family protein [Geodermatophilus sabuli]|uniref:Uncharacterized protein n=1 Tax=Geodermatophilus sabuli TaxID=1564158 RepID=A0A285EKD7_9ACTN|nr:DUF6186 family protein [Geodermatophilus sabuli]MBB3083875.1 hypothetical protein [Geodermatophilus sabuli]SNX98526.1 hypothetical protein SAMN06893097_11140 [Geodermatophilus sabuli]